MKANLPKTPPPPKSWDRLPDFEKRAIEEYWSKRFNAQLDHEEAILQKRWLQLACIVLHNQKDRYGKFRCMAFLAGWKRVYRKCEKFNTNAEIDAYLKTEMDSIFGVDGYPYEWVDSLER